MNRSVPDNLKPIMAEKESVMIVSLSANAKRKAAVPRKNYNKKKNASNNSKYYMTNEVVYIYCFSSWKD